MLFQNVGIGGELNTFVPV